MSQRPEGQVGRELPGGGVLGPNGSRAVSSDSYSHDPLVLGNWGPGQSGQSVDDL